MPDKKAYSQYKETQIMTASPAKLIILLYEGAIKSIDSAMAAIDEKKFDVVNNNVLKAQDIITELAVSVNFDAGDLASKLYNLYMYFNKCLLEANIKKDKESFKHVRDHIENLLDAWKSIADKVIDVTNQSRGVNIAG